MKRFFDTEREAFEKASPMDRVHADAPPFLVIHGDLDTLAPVEDCRHFVEQLRAVSASPVVYAEMKGAQHAFEIFPSYRTARVIEGVERFLTTLWHHDTQRRGGDDHRKKPSSKRRSPTDHGADVRRGLVGEVDAAIGNRLGHLVGEHVAHQVEVAGHVVVRREPLGVALEVHELLGDEHELAGGVGRRTPAAGRAAAS